jgi:TolB-like protein/Tfp pilus assembly protein PilF
VTGAVFLSYASQDAEAARSIAEALRSASVEVWFDKSELRGGDAWDAAIRRQIKACALFIPIISRNTHAREEGYFRLEWKLAVDRSHLMTSSKAFLLPVVVDSTLEDDDRVPEKFREVQWTRLPPGETPPAFVERVIGLLSPDEHAAPAPMPLAAQPRSEAAVSNARTPAVEAATKSAASWRSRPALLLTAAAIFIAAGYVAVDRFVPSKRMTDAGKASPASLQLGPSGQSAILERSIAVLPFVDMSERKDQEYFADGMAAEVLDLLAKIPGIRVIGRTSSFQFKSKTDDLRTIGAKLGVAYLVEGSVRKSGDHVRVTAELIDVRDGAQRWSSTYDRKSSDLLAVQDEIALNLARALQVTVSSDFGARASTRSIAAYDVYLRGLNALDQWSQESTDHAAGDFQQSLDLDPNFAPAALGLAKTYRVKGEYGWLPTGVAFERARQAANLALRLDPKLGGPHAELAKVHETYDWDWAAADMEIKQAMKLGDRVDAIEAAAQLAAVRCEWDQAVQFVEMGFAEDPLNANLYLILAWDVDLRSGRFAKAESAMRRALEINPTFGAGHWFLGQSLLLQDRLDEALAVMQKETPDDGQFEGTAIVYHAMHKKADSDAALKRAVEHDGEVWPSAIAEAYAFRDERDKAMYWLERAYSMKDEDLFLLKGDPLMRNLEGDPRYTAFLRKMNLPECAASSLP